METDLPTSDFHIQDEASLRQLFGTAHGLAVQKSLPKLSAHAQAFIRRSPFLCIGTQSADGRADVSPRGDPPGFVQILDDHTLAIPDRPGNNRLDTLANIIANPTVGLLFMIPGFDDTLRVNGRAIVVNDPDLLAGMAIQNKPPKAAIVVRVTEAFLHCAKAFRRSHLWDPDHAQDRSSMPSLVKMILDDTTGAPETASEMRQLDEALEQDYQKSMY